MSSDDDDVPLAVGARRFFPSVGAPPRVLASPTSPSDKGRGASAEPAAGDGEHTPAPSGGAGGSPVPDWIKSATPKKRPPSPTPSASSDSDDDAPLAAVLGKKEGSGGAKAPARPPPADRGRPASARKPQSAGPAAEPAAAAAKPTAVPVAAPSRPAPPGELPLIMPDRLPLNRFIVEAEDAADGGRADLAGDAGVVGRVTAASTGADGGPPSSSSARVARLDLKGRLYRISTLPCASSLALVAVGPADARLEALTTTYLRLDPEDGGDDDDDESRGRAIFEEDGGDGDEWWGGGGGGEAAPGGAAKKKGGGGAKKKGANPYAGGGGVKKPRAKAKAKPKAKGGGRKK